MVYVALQVLLCPIIKYVDDFEKIKNLDNDYFSIFRAMLTQYELELIFFQFLDSRDEIERWSHMFEQLKAYL